MSIKDPRSDARSLSPQAQEDLRRKAVSAVLEEGMSQVKVAKLFGVGRQTVNRWVNEYKTDGVRALKAGKRGRPPVPSLLRANQAALVVKWIMGGCPDQLLLPFSLWTREAVRALIARKFRINVSVSTAGRLLRRWGMSPQRPARRAYERDDAAVKQWLSERYPAIAARAKRENAEIHWGDQTGFRSDDQRGRSYSKRGITPVVVGTGKRFKCNMMSSITNRGHLSFMVFENNFTGVVMIQFLKRLVAQCRSEKARRGEKTAKVFLIVDGHPAHRSKLVRAYVAANSNALELFYLPGYSPDLNPDELVNQDAKQVVRASRPKTSEELASTVRSHMRSRQHHPEVVRRFFTPAEVRYAAA